MRKSSRPRVYVHSKPQPKSHRHGVGSVGRISLPFTRSWWAFRSPTSLPFRSHSAWIHLRFVTVGLNSSLTIISTLLGSEQPRACFLLQGSPDPRGLPSFSSGS